MSIRIRGRDSLGKFILSSGNSSGKRHEQECVGCHKNTGVLVKYAPSSFNLPTGIDVAFTILKSPNNRIGILCGCYARFHRQIAHISDNLKSKG